MTENIHDIETFVTLFIYNLNYKLKALGAHGVYVGSAYTMIIR